jgi:hypothetical protein
MFLSTATLSADVIINITSVIVSIIISFGALLNTQPFVAVLVAATVRRNRSANTFLLG